MRTDPSVSREDLEAYQIDVERKREQVEGFKTVERIISSREVEANEDVGYQHRELPFSQSTTLKSENMLIKCFSLQWSTSANGKA